MSSKLVLTPTGNGSTEHLGEDVSLPGAIELKEGLYEVRHMFAYCIKWLHVFE